MSCLLITKIGKPSNKLHIIFIAKKTTTDNYDNKRKEKKQIYKLLADQLNINYD